MKQENHKYVKSNHNTIKHFSCITFLLPIPQYTQIFVLISNKKMKQSILVVHEENHKNAKSISQNTIKHFQAYFLFPTPKF